MSIVTETAKGGALEVRVSNIEDPSPEVISKALLTAPVPAMPWLEREVMEIPIDRDYLVFLGADFDYDGLSVERYLYRCVTNRTAPNSEIRVMYCGKIDAFIHNPYETLINSYVVPIDATREIATYGLVMGWKMRRVCVDLEPLTLPEFLREGQYIVNLNSLIKKGYRVTEGRVSLTEDRSVVLGINRDGLALYLRNGVHDSSNPEGAAEFLEWFGQLEKQFTLPLDP